MWGWRKQPVVLGAGHHVGNSVLFTPLKSFHSSAGMVAKKDFKGAMKRIWFKLYGHEAGKLTTANFEHIFMGETRDMPFK